MLVYSQLFAVLLFQLFPMMERQDFFCNTGSQYELIVVEWHPFLKKVFKIPWENFLGKTKTELQSCHISFSIPTFISENIEEVHK